MKTFSIQTLAVVFLGLLFTIGRAHLAYSTADPQAVKQLKNWVAAEYTRYQLGRDNLSLDEKALMLEHIRNIEFISVNAFGPADDMVFRIEIKPNPAQPPSTPALRYFRMSYSPVIGWNSVPTKTSPLAYYLALFKL